MPYRQATGIEPLGPARVEALSGRLIGIMVALHEVDPTSVGLSEFGRAEGFLARQVRRWKTQIDTSHPRDLPAADELYHRLAARVEEVERVGSAPGIVYGDTRRLTGSPRAARTGQPAASRGKSEAVLRRSSSSLLTSLSGLAASAPRPSSTPSGGVNG